MFVTRIRLRAALSAGLAAALVACVPAPGTAGPSPAPSTAASGAPVAAAPPGASPAASPAVPAAFSPVVGNAAYHGETRGYLASPPSLPAGGKAPAVVMIHEWWGLNDHIKSQADLLAKEGYTVLAVDLFGGKYATNQEGARSLTGGLVQEAATANLKAAVTFLRARPDVAKVASLGWCFGGGQSLKLLMAQPDLAAGVIYYGALESDAAKVKGLPPIFGAFGKLDQGPSPAQVAAFEAALTASGVTKEIHSYEGAGHAFANPSGGDRYKPDAAKDAWAKTLAFLAKHTK